MPHPSSVPATYLPRPPVSREVNFRVRDFHTHSPPHLIIYLDPMSFRILDINLLDSIGSGLSGIDFAGIVEIREIDAGQMFYKIFHGRYAYAQMIVPVMLLGVFCVTDRSEEHTSELQS